MRSWTRETPEVRQRVEREVHFRRRAAELVAIHIDEELAWQCVRFEQAAERQPRIEARHDEAGGDLVAVLQHDAAARPSRTRIFATSVSDRISTPA